MDLDIELLLENSQETESPSLKSEVTNPVFDDEVFDIDSYMPEMRKIRDMEQERRQREARKI
jgi:hypothetical protein